MRRLSVYKYFIQSFILFLLSGSTLWAIEGRLVCEEGLLDPGGMTTLRVFVSNGDTPFEGTLSVSLPEGIIPLVNGRGSEYRANVSLDAGSRDLILIPIRVANSMRKGDYKITARMLQNGDSEVTSFSCDVRVGNVTGVVVLPMHSSGSVLAPGDESTLSYQVTNTGNTTVEVDLGYAMGNRGRGVLSPEKLMLAPGESETVTLTFNAPRGRSQDTVQTFYVSLRGNYREAGTTTFVPTQYFSQVSQFQLLPGSQGGSLYWTIPSRSSLIFIADDNNEALFLRLTGGGQLWEERNEYLRWLIQTPDSNVSGGGLAAEERYSFWFGGLNYEVRAGDHYNSVSDLTQLNFFGRGAAVDFSEGPWSVSAFGFDQRRRGGLPEEQYGASLGYDFTPFNSVRANFLRRNFKGDQIFNWDDADIVSLQTINRFSDLLMLETELALSDSTEDDWAVMIRASGRYEDRWTYSAQFIQANADYAGYYRDQRSMSYGTTYRIDDQWSIVSSFSRNESNFDLDASQGFAGVSQLFTIGPFYRLSRATTVGVEYLDYERRDKIAPRAYDFSQTTGRFSVSHQFSPQLRGGGSIEVGEQKNNLTDESKDYLRGRVFANFNPNSKQNYSIFAESGDDRYTDRLTSSHSVGGGASYLVNGATRFYFSGIYTTYDDTNVRDRVNVSGRVTHTFRNDHELSAGVRVNRGRRRDIGTPAGEIIEERKYYFVSYTIPFDVPTSVRKDIGLVRGVVYADSDMTTPLPGVAVTIEGRRSISNRDGSFEIPRLRAGNYVVRVDRTTLSPDVRANLPENFMVTIEPGQATVLDFSVIKSARIAGRIKLNGNGSGNGTNGNGNGRNGNDRVDALAMSTLAREVNYQELVLEITGADEQRTIVAGEDGRFDFFDLLPGNYTVRLYDANLPRGYVIAEPVQTMTLEAGESRDMEFRLVPRERRIRIIDEGELTQVSMADRKPEKKD